MVYGQRRPATSEHVHVHRTTLGPAGSHRANAGQIDDVAFVRSPGIGLAPWGWYARELAVLATKSSVHSELVHLTRVINPYPLCGLLFCQCGAPFCRWGSPDSTREYMAVCGCRLWPIDAVTIERRVCSDAAERDSPVVAGGWTEIPGEVLARLYARIEVGGTVDDVRFVPRI